MDEPLKYLNRAELQKNILSNIEREIMQLTKNNRLRAWWEMSPNWVRVQAFMNGNTNKAGSTSSAEQCEYIGLDPNSRELLNKRKAE